MPPSSGSRWNSPLLEDRHARRAVAVIDLEHRLISAPRPARRRAWPRAANWPQHILEKFGSSAIHSRRSSATAADGQRRIPQAAAIVKAGGGNDEKKYGGFVGIPALVAEQASSGWRLLTQCNTKISLSNSDIDNFVLQCNIGGCRHDWRRAVFVARSLWRDERCVTGK